MRGVGSSNLPVPTISLLASIPSNPHYSRDCRSRAPQNFSPQRSGGAKKSLARGTAQPCLAPSNLPSRPLVCWPAFPPTHITLVTADHEHAKVCRRSTAEAQRKALRGERHSRVRHPQICPSRPTNSTLAPLPDPCAKHFDLALLRRDFREKVSLSAAAITNLRYTFLGFLEDRGSALLKESMFG